MKPWCATIKMTGVKKYFWEIFVKIIQNEIYVFIHFELGTLWNDRVKEKRMSMIFQPYSWIDIFSAHLMTCFNNLQKGTCDRT